MPPAEEQRASALRALFEEATLICTALSRAEIPLARAERLVADAVLAWAAAGATPGQLHLHVKHATLAAQTYRKRTNKDNARRRRSPVQAARLTLTIGRPHG